MEYPPISTLFGIIAVMACVGGLLAGLALYQRCRAPDPEWVRKLMHIGSGLVALSFPWAFDRTWPVLCLSLLSFSAMVALRRVRGLRQRYGRVVAAVERGSWGEYCFPLAIGTVFVLAEGNVALYVVPVSILTFADAAAALFGKRFGTVHYRIFEGKKSLEGTITFFVVALLCICVPLALLDGHFSGNLLLAAFLVSAVLALAEAVSWGGMDNLTVPLTGFFALRSYLLAPAELLVEHLLLVGILVPLLGMGITARPSSVRQ